MVAGVTAIAFSRAKGSIGTVVRSTGDAEKLDGPVGGFATVDFAAGSLPIGAASIGPIEVASTCGASAGPVRGAIATICGGGVGGGGNGSKGGMETAAALSSFRPGLDFPPRTVSAALAVVLVRADVAPAFGVGTASPGLVGGSRAVSIAANAWGPSDASGTAVAGAGNAGPCVAVVEFGAAIRSGVGNGPSASRRRKEWAKSGTAFSAGYRPVHPAILAARQRLPPEKAERSGKMTLGVNPS